MTRLSFYTLVLAATVAQLSLTTGANGLQNVAPHRRAPEPAVAHVDLNKRMLRKRVPQGPLPVNSNTSTSTSTTSSTTTSPSQTSTTTTRTTTTTTTSSVTTPSSTSSSSSSSSSSSPSSAAPAPTSSTPTQSTRSTSRANSTVLVTQTASSTPPPSQDPNNSFLPRSAVIGLIVAGSCIAAGAAIWTVIRKWKFSPSRQFEDRLEPVNWEPTQSSGLPNEKVDGLSPPGTNRNSFANGSVRNMSTNQEMAPDFPPAHDFTAGSTNGYVNMYRGPSPAPPSTYGGAPSNYGAPSTYGGHYETPNPYDAYDYNNTNAAYGQRRY